MNNYFFTSDWHINHANVIKYCNRPYANVKEMAEGLVSNFNEVVKDGDLTFHLGDLAFHMTDEDMGKFYRQLNGQHVFITGNHDRDRIYGLPGSVHYRILELKRKHWGDYAPTLSHFPQLVWNKSHYGTFNLHGHCHGNLPDDPAVRRMDVGIDCNNYKPFHWDEIVAKLGSRPISREGRSGD